MALYVAPSVRSAVLRLFFAPAWRCFQARISRLMAASSRPEPWGISMTPSSCAPFAQNVPAYWSVARPTEMAARPIPIGESPR